MTFVQPEISIYAPGLAWAPFRTFARLRSARIVYPFAARLGATTLTTEKSRNLNVVWPFGIVRRPVIARRHLTIAYCERCQRGYPVLIGFLKCPCCRFYPQY